MGEELIQFKRAEPLGDDRWRLSGLWRGRRGTAATAHPVDTAFTLIEDGSAVPLGLPITAVGGTVRVIAAGPGDPVEGVAAALPLSGLTIVPPSPVHLRLVGARLTWVRRSRAGWPWTDGGDVPLGEEMERYRVSVVASDAVRTIETVEPAIDLMPGEMAAGTIVEVRQIGTHGASAPARITT